LGPSDPFFFLFKDQAFVSVFSRREFFADEDEEMAPSVVTSSDTTRPDRFITSEIGAISAISVSSPSRDTLAVDLTLAICVFRFFKPKLILGDEALA
jgi:hypothetical protein